MAPKDRQEPWDYDRICDMEYRRAWLDNHHSILMALQCKDTVSARQSMWQHIENVREILIRLSGTDDSNFDEFLFQRVNTAG